MVMTEEERFRFDLTGFLVRPAILSKTEVEEIFDQIDRVKHKPKSLPPEHRDVPGGPSSVLIDHPKIIDVRTSGTCAFCVPYVITYCAWCVQLKI